MTEVTNKAGLAPTQIDWKRLRFITDDDIACAVADDPNAAPVPTASELQQYKPAPARNKR